MSTRTLESHEILYPNHITHVVFVIYDGTAAVDTVDTWLDDMAGDDLSYQHLMLYNKGFSHAAIARATAVIDMVAEAV